MPKGEIALKDIQDIVKGAMESIKDMIGSEQVIGTPITTPNGDTVIPVTQLTFGFGAGGSDIPSKADAKGAEKGFGGGTGGGVRIKPVAFLVISEGRIKLLPVTNSSSAIDKILDFVPDILDKFNSEEKKEK